MRHQQFFYWVEAACWQCESILHFKLRLWKDHLTEKTHYDFPFRCLMDEMAVFSVVMSVLLPLRSYSRNSATALLTLRRTVLLSRCLPDCFSSDMDSVTSVLQMELECRTDLKVKFIKALGKPEMIGEFLQELPLLIRTVQNVQAGHVSGWRHI